MLNVEQRPLITNRHVLDGKFFYEDNSISFVTNLTYALLLKANRLPYILIQDLRLTSLNIMCAIDSFVFVDKYTVIVKTNKVKQKPTT